MNTFSYNEQNGITCNGATVETNINLISIDQLQNRFIADIQKDAYVPKPPIKSDILNKIFNDCFLGYTVLPDYKGVLKGLEKYVRETILEPNDEKVLPNVFKKEHTVLSEQTILSNVLKTSTVGSNIKISNATKIFRESGFKPEEICINPNFVKIGTPAGILDSGDKGEPSEWFPQTKIKFDNSFCERLGFPIGTTWECSTTNQLEGNYEVTIKYGKDDSLKDIITPSERGIFEPYRTGNEQKNIKINIMNINSLDCTEAKKLLVTKELGDVAQIWLYLAYICLTPGQQESRQDSLMITTDSVVYLFCAILHLSCIYTGAREGVESGRCTLKHFIAGEVDYALKFHNMSTAYYSRLKQHNETILKGLETIKNTFGPNEGKSNISPFAYYRILENRTLRLTTGDYNVTKDKENGYIEIITAFESEIEKIKNKITKLDDIYNNPSNHIDIFEYWLDDSIINRWYNEYCKKMDEHKCEQWITQISVRNYMLHPGSLLDIIALKVGVTVPKIIKDLEQNQTQVGGVFEFSSEINESSYTITNEIFNKDQSFGYYECLFLCFIYETKFSKQINNDEDKIRFAMVYDHYVSLLKNDTNIDTILPGIIEYNNTKQEDDILLKGNELGEYIYFSENWHYTDRTKELNRIMFKHARKINVKKIMDQLIENNKNKTNVNKKRKMDPPVDYRQVPMVSSDDMSRFKRPAIFANGGKKKQTKKKKNIKKRNTKKRRRTIKNKIK